MDGIIKKKTYIQQPCRIQSQSYPTEVWWESQTLAKIYFALSSLQNMLVFTNIEKIDCLTQALTGHTYTTVESSLVLDSSVPIILAMVYGKPEHSLSYYNIEYIILHSP